MHRLFVFLLFLAGHLFPQAIFDAQDRISFTVSDPVIEFGSGVHFIANIHPKDAFQEVILFVQSQGKNTLAQKVPVVDGTIDYKLDIQQVPIRPFAQATFWFEGVNNDERITSDKFSFDYIDNRFNWQSKEDTNFQVNWSEGDSIFGQTVLDLANNSIQNAQNYLNISGLSGKVRIFVYANASDLQNALQLSQQDWIAGQTSTDLRTVLISVPDGPEQRLELERQIPHEISHILEYDLLGNAYLKIPTWLLEGTASLTELYPNPDYPRVLEKSTKNGTLKPIIALCSGFPQEASGAFQAYAEAASFTRYLYQKYGFTKMNELFKAYQDGLGCEEGALKVIGVPLSQLDTRWQQDVLGINPWAIAVRNLTPFVLIFLVIVIPSLFSGIYALRK